MVLNGFLFLLYRTFSSALVSQRVSLATAYLFLTHGDVTAETEPQFEIHTRQESEVSISCWLKLPRVNGGVPSEVISR